MSLEFHHRVQRDVNEILSYYAKAAGPELADRFFSALQSRLKQVAVYPARFSPYPPNPRFQRAFIEGFPYIICFRMKSGHPRIIAVKHQSRHPRHGLSRW